MSEHAMEWINRACHLQPPIDQTEMVDQITSHFSYNITLALRGLRITTTNELVQQLTYLQRAYAPSNNNNNHSDNNHNSNLPNNFQHQNSYNNSSGSNNQNRYHLRQNNYNRNQQHKNNTPSSPQPERSSPSSGNSA